MTSRKWRSTRRAQYSRRLVELRGRPTRFARSEAAASDPARIRDSSPFQDVDPGALGPDVSEPRVDVARILADHVADVIAACNPKLDS